MKTYFETERLILRQFKESDFEDLYKYFNDKNYWKFLSYNYSDKEILKKIINDSIIEGNENKIIPSKIAAVKKDDNKLIGLMIFLIFNKVFRTWEIGYLLNPEFHNQGFATEASLKLLEYAFEKLNAHRVVATCDTRNTASYKVLEKIGMRREAHFIKNILIGNEWHDEYFYAIYDNEWYNSKMKNQL